MRLQSLIRVADATAALVGSRRLVVLGSSSLLASFPEMGEPAGPLESSFDADLLIDGIDENLAGVLAETIGKGSPFHIEAGYFADTLRPVVAETFPAGWEERLVPLSGCPAVFCLDPHDLGAIKVQVGRMKDLELCATLIATKRLHPDVIQDRLQVMAMDDPLRVLSTIRLKKILEMAGER